MFPASSAILIAALLAVGGLLSCVAGHRLFRIILGLYGFYFGAAVTTQLFPPASTWALVIAAVVGGIVGAMLIVAAYFIGVGLVGAFLAALVVNAGWRFLPSLGPEPPTMVLVVICVLGALAALSIQKYVLIIGTAFAGSWTLLIGVLALMRDTAAMKAASAGDVFVLYPLDPQPTRWWLLPAWIGIALMGAVIQFGTARKASVRKAVAKAGK